MSGHGANTPYNVWAANQIELLAARVTELESSRGSWKLRAEDAESKTDQMEKAFSALERITDLDPNTDNIRDAINIAYNALNP